MGRRNPPEIQAWRDMIYRCERPATKAYSRYGGRGITVCQRWRNSFEAFFEDVGPRPSARHSLDRIDNAGNYEPGNVRWATALEQTRNRRNTRWLTVNGETMTVQEWASRTGLSATTIRWRLAHGWSIAEAVSRPLATAQRPLEAA